MICGIDAGGTKTTCVVMNESGEIILDLTLGTMHFMKVGYEGITLQLKEIENIFIENKIDLKSLHLVLGLAGYGEDPVIRKNIESAVYTVFPNAYIMSDAQFAHYAFLEGDAGVLVIAGTGSIALRKENKAWTRRGGFGYLIDDAGSAYWIGKRILQAYAREVDGQLEKTPIFDCINETFNLKNGYEMIELVNKQKGNYRNWVAELARITSWVKDDVLNLIYQDAGIALAQMANSFIVNKETKLSISGSVLQNNTRVYDTFVNHLNSNYKVIKPTQRIEYGAYLHYRRIHNKGD